MADPAPHLELVRLYNLPCGDFLRHRVTGEVHRLPAEGRPWRLVFDSQGMGAVANNDDTQALWCSQLFARHLHLGERTGYDEKQWFISRGGSTRWHTDCKGEVVAKCFGHSKVWNNEVCEWQTQVYWHEVPPACGQARCALWWCVPHWVDFVYDSSYSDTNGNFIGKNQATWKRMLDKLRLEESETHLRPSIKSQISKARAQHSLVDSALVTSGEQEFTMSTQALLLLTASMASCSKFRSVSEDAACRATKVLHLVLDKFADFISFVVACPCGDRLRVEKLSVVFELEGAPGRHLVAGLRLLKKVLGPNETTLPELILAMVRELSSRHTSSVQASLASCLRMVVHEIAMVVECSRQSSIWQEVSHLSLKVLAGKSRTRRLPVNYKHAVSQCVDHSMGIATAGQVLAVQQVVNKKRKDLGEDTGSIETSPGKRVAGSIDVCECYQYWLAGRAVGARTRNFQIATDGTRCAGEEVESSCIHSVQTGLDFWLPLQVFAF